MASRKGGFAQFFVKWFLVPMLLAAVGFFVIGPRIGSASKGPKIIQAPPVTEETLGEEPKKFHGEPKVDVEAEPVTRRRSRRSSTRSSQSGRSASPASAPIEAAPVEEPNPEPEIPADGQGADGATALDG
jgi:hypothetical protein